MYYACINMCFWRFSWSSLNLANVLSGEFAERNEAKAASEGTFFFETHKFFVTFLQFNGIFQLFHVRTMTEGSPKDDRVEQLAFFDIFLVTIKRCAKVYDF